MYECPLPFRFSEGEMEGRKGKERFVLTLELEDFERQQFSER